MKKRGDATLTLLHNIHTKPITDIKSRERATARNLIVKADDMRDIAGLSLIDHGQAFASVWHSVRGLHTALYLEHLPSSTPHRCIAPVPDLGRAASLSVDQQLAQRMFFSERVTAAVEAAVQSDEWDGITAWGGTLEYRCIWHLLEDDPHPAMCMWMMNNPVAREWGESSMGAAIPWHGVYKSDYLPRGASLLSDKACELLNRPGESH